MTAASGNIESNYCRLCYNKAGWREPTHSAIETGTYYAQNGFGHEEWLFRYEWCIGRYKYGFLEPFRHGLQSRQGSTFFLKLYTKLPGHTYFVGTIDKVYVPYEDEVEKAFAHMRERGWYDQMRAEVSALEGTNPKALDDVTTSLFFNVRFEPSDVDINLDMPEMFKPSIPAKYPRYRLRPDDDVPVPKSSTRRSPGNLKAVQYVRAEQQGTIVDPAHARLQLKLYAWLCKKHGKKAVGFEVDFVDLRVTKDGKTTFYEIKTDSSAQRCIRNALGQLFEYSTYPSETNADKWIVVGDPVPTADDIAYLGHLRRQFRMPIHYAQFDWETGTLKASV
jgi:hypothetical protein